MKKLKCILAVAPTIAIAEPEKISNLVCVKGTWYCNYYYYFDTLEDFCNFLARQIFFAFVSYNNNLQRTKFIEGIGIFTNTHKNIWELINNEVFGKIEVDIKEDLYIEQQSKEI